MGVEQYESSDVIKICDVITFDFYTGLTHISFRSGAKNTYIALIAICIEIASL